MRKVYKQSIKLEDLSMDNADVEPEERDSLLRSQIRSKIINEQIPNDLPKEFFEQIHYRDLYIEELNEKIIKLNAKFGHKSRTSPIQEGSGDSKLNDVVQNLRIELRGKIEELEELKEQFSQAKEEWVLEKESFQDLSLELQKENDQLVQKHEAKLQTINEMKDDIKKLAQVIQQMTSLNSDLNSKINEMNKQMEAANIKCYEAESKNQQYDDLQKQYQKVYSECRTLEKQNVRLQKQLQTVRQQKIEIEDLGRETQDGLRVLSERVFGFAKAVYDLLSDELWKDRVMGISKGLKEMEGEVTQLRHALKMKIPLEPPPISNDEILPDTLAQEKILELQADLKLLRNDNLEAGNRVAFALERAERYKEQLNNQREQFEEYNKNSEKADGAFQSTYDQIQDRIAQYRTEIVDVQIQLSQAQNAYETLKQKHETLQQVHQDLKEHKEQIAQTLKQLRQKWQMMMNQRDKREILLRQKEHRAHKVLTLNQALQNELFQRDNELMRKNRQIKKHEQEIMRLNKQLLLSKDEVEKRVNAALYQTKKVLENKESQLSILKDMVHKNKVQERYRHRSIPRVKRGYNSSTPSTHLPTSLDISTVSTVRDPTLDDAYLQISNFVKKIDDMLDQLNKKLRLRNLMPKDLEMHKFPANFKPKEFLQNEFRKKSELMLSELESDLPESIYGVLQIYQSCKSNRLRSVVHDKKKITKDELIASLTRLINDFQSP